MTLSFSMLLETTIAAQGCYAGRGHWVILDAADDGWNICIVVRQVVNCFEASFTWSYADDDAAVNAGPRERRVLHERNSSPME